jgi:hypothetical protein
VDPKLRAILRELGDAINESVSESERVHATIERLHDQGYRLFLNLDARIGIERDDEEMTADEAAVAPHVDFRIDVRDLRFLKSVGIDPTRKVRARRAPARRVSRRSR